MSAPKKIPGLGVLTARLRLDGGAAAMEYALVAGLVAVVIIGAAGAVGGDLEGAFTRLVQELNVVAGA